jgi:diamine N-acetyltransferase
MTRRLGKIFMMNSVSFRIALQDDAVLLAELGAQSFEQAFGVENTPEDMQAYLRASFSPEIQAHELAEPGSVFLIAEIDEKPAGYAQLRSDPAPTCITGSFPIHLERFYLLQQWVGKGLG